MERSSAELRIEAQAVLAALAIKLQVDAASGTSLVGGIDQAAKDLSAKRLAKDPGAAAAWDRLAELLYIFDAHVQDTLTATSDTQACGYQLGRGLAEAYWALAPAAGDADSVGSWSFLLGSDRCDELSRMVGRLSGYFNAYTAPAVAGCLQVWKEVAIAPAWRGSPESIKDLYLQIRRWYELLILGQDPSTLVEPFALLKSFRVLTRTLRLFWPQLVGALVSLAAVVIAIALIANGSGTPLGRTLVGAAGAIGLSATSFSAKLKSSAQALLQRIREDAYTDLVAVAITIVPPPAGTQRLPRTTTPTERAVTRMVRNRQLTTAVSV
jgi:hypothetical protein